MTVACDGGAGAHAGVRHCGERRATPTKRAAGNTHGGLSFAISIFKARACSSLLLIKYAPKIL
jgi:hypothetical protein